MTSFSSYLNFYRCDRLNRFCSSVIVKLMTHLNEDQNFYLSSSTKETNITRLTFKEAPCGKRLKQRKKKTKDCCDRDTWEKTWFISFDKCECT